MDIDDLIDGTADEVESAIEDLLGEIDEDQKPVVQAATRRLIELQFQWLAEPDNREQIERDMRHNVSTLTIEANLAQVRAAERLNETFKVVLTKAADVLVGLV